ncbi:hypothetical protein Tco_1580112, partial [Tanacetum coccineum]
EEFTESEAVVRDVFYDLMVNIKAITKDIAVEVCRNRWLHDIPPPYHKQLFEITGWRERALRKRRIQMVLLLALISSSYICRKKHLKHLKSQDNIINLKDQRMQPSRGNSKNVQRHQQSNQ